MKSLKKGDILILIIVIIGISVFFIYKNFNNSDSTDKIAIIKLKGKIYKEINLNNSSDDEIIIKNKFVSKIIIKDHKIRFIDSNCPDLVCENTGWLSKINDISICIPNELSIKITGKKDSEFEVDEVAS